jgi:hypothetical protein
MTKLAQYDTILDLLVQAVRTLNTPLDDCEPSPMIDHYRHHIGLHLQLCERLVHDYFDMLDVTKADAPH